MLSGTIHNTTRPFYVGHETGRPHGMTDSRQRACTVFLYPAKHHLGLFITCDGMGYWLQTFHQQDGTKTCHPSFRRGQAQATIKLWRSERLNCREAGLPRSLEPLPLEVFPNLLVLALRADTPR